MIFNFKIFCSSICGKGFTVRSNAAIHEKRHLGAVTPNEPVNRNGPQIQSRSGSSKTYVKTSKNNYECPKCHMDFERGGKVFANHVARCIGVLLQKKVSYRYPCFLCEKKFCTKISAAEHMATKHNLVIESVEKMCFECKVEVEDPMAHAKMHNCLFGCTHCGYRFNTQRKLDNHLRDRHDDSNRPFTCDLCNISFKTTNHLRSHMATMHTAAEDKKFVCKICSRRYPFKYQLNTHMKASHSDVRR